jgi:CRP/FNR family nitrogen fixation transcriptional regulator
MWAITVAELHRAQQHMLLLIKSAEERLGSFLLEMEARSRMPNEIDLPMSRQDIADYLGLTIETVSRNLTKLEMAGIIELPTTRCVMLHDRSAIGRLGV